MKLGAASAVACVAGSMLLAGSSAIAAEPTTRRRTRFLLDCHVHVGGSPGLKAMLDQVQTPKDWLALRGRQPEAFAAAASEPQKDNSEDLIAKMDEYGVTHALIQKDNSEDLIAKMDEYGVTHALIQATPGRNQQSDDCRRCAAAQG